MIVCDIDDYHILQKLVSNFDPEWLSKQALNGDNRSVINGDDTTDLVADGVTVQHDILAGLFSQEHYIPCGLFSGSAGHCLEITFYLNDPRKCMVANDASYAGTYNYELSNVNFQLEVVKLPESVTSIQGMLEAINPILKDYPAFEEPDVSELRNEAVAKIDNVLATEFKSKSEAYKIKKRETEQIDSWDTIKEEIEKVYPVGTEQYLYINIFEQAPSRDDLANLFVYDNFSSIKVEDMENKNKLLDLKADIKRYANDGRNNAVILHKTGAIFAFYNYKTSNLYGDQFVKIDGNLRQLIDDYISNGLIDTQLFPTKGNKMTTFVSNMLKKAGLKGDSSKNKGAINLLRKALITKKTEELQQISDITEADRIALAKLMRHSVVISPTYLRKIRPTYETLSTSVKDKLDEEAEKEGLTLALPAPPEPDVDIDATIKPKRLRRSNRKR